MAWVSDVGDLWRTGGDIRAEWKSITANAHSNNAWASNGRPGHFNDADMLEVGNGDLTLAEQRSHFALWCIMKSPLILGTCCEKAIHTPSSSMTHDATRVSQAGSVYKV